MHFNFEKYQGSGSDFIILDNRTGAYDKLTKQDVFLLCDRHYGVGASGLLIFNDHPDYPFEMRYYTAFGNEGIVSGTGEHCMTIYAREKGLIGREETAFWAKDGERKTQNTKADWVKVMMPDVTKIDFDYDSARLDTGFLNYVKLTEYLGDVDIRKEGFDMNEQEEYKMTGINLNYIEYATDALWVRTYERAAGEEVLCSGTGIVAGAVIVAGNQNKHYNIPVQMKGGDLRITFDKISQQHVTNIWLYGQAEKVFSGEFEVSEKWKKRLGTFEEYLR